LIRSKRRTRQPYRAQAFIKGKKEVRMEKLRSSKNEFQKEKKETAENSVPQSSIQPYKAKNDVVLCAECTQKANRFERI